MPLLILFPAFWVIRPTIPGPILPPKSPAMARRENIAVPPFGNVFEEILIVPGHIIPTENPQTAQPTRLSIGTGTKNGLVLNLNAIVNFSIFLVDIIFSFF